MFYFKVDRAISLSFRRYLSHLQNQI